MERSNGRKKNTMLRAAGVLFALVLVTTWMTTGLLARYVVTAGGEDEARVAAFVFRVKDGAAQNIQLSLEGIKVPGANLTYTFDVTNKDGKVSEVAQQYSVTMTLDGSLPLQCTLKRDTAKSTNAAEASASIVTLPGTTQMPVSATTITETFAAAEESTDRYTLTVSWPNEYNDPKYAYGAASIELAFSSEQIN